jgi:hypothetical protein
MNILGKLLKPTKDRKRREDMVRKMDFDAFIGKQERSKITKNNASNKKR